MTLIAFKGKDRIHIFDRQDIKDDLLTQFNSAVFFLTKHLNRRSEIKGINREDIYEIPLEALREAVANAIIHRDYGMPGTSLMVEVYDDRVEIINPGGLPKGLEKKDLGKISVRRNARIADLFFRMDKVELAGTGIRRMKEAMAAAELPPPKIRQTTFFTITFQRPAPQHTADAALLKDSAVRLNSGVEKGTGNLSLNEKIIYDLIRNNPSISKQMVAKEGNLTKKTVEYNLIKLKDKGVIKRVGPDRGGYWEIVNV